ncbi:MAG: hypothetical protein AAF291_05115 [Pseudomonadota bacterium]
MMSRRLLALLAILSGLAALHAPASAARLDELSYDIETLAEMVNSGGGAACQCERPPKKRNRGCEKQSKKAVRLRLVGVHAPSVVVGADFSLE